MPFDKNQAAEWIRSNALKPYGKHECATHVRKALEAGGLDTSGHPKHAKDWGLMLARLGFRCTSDAAKIGDIIVMQGTSTSSSGHIEFYDGKNWVSDFVQREIWPGPGYRVEKPQYETYRYNS